MTKKQTGPGTPADPGAAHIEIGFYPYRDDTQVAITLVRGLGSRRTCMRVWSGLIGVTRSDLHGLGAADVALMLCGELRAVLGDSDPESIAPPTDSPARQRSGAPVGATGATVTTVPGQIELF